jgi:putative SOS response-associated peptidase YedK
MNNPEKLQRLYQSYPAELLQEREVSSMVNNPTHDSPENITPVIP